MRQIDFLGKMLILLVFSVFLQKNLSAQDFEVFNSWDFENDALGQYTDAVIKKDFNVGFLISHNTTDIVEDVINGNTTRVLRIRHDGGQLSYGLDLQVKLGKEYDELYMSYDFKFSDEFNSTEGGKLPGFLGFPRIPANECPGDDDGFVIKSHFKEGGRVITYHYDRTPGHGYPTWCPWASEAYNYDTIYFNNGCWYNITRRLVMNTFTGGVANPDGIHEVWIDGRMMFKETGLIVMSKESDTMKIDGIHIAHWYGGSSIGYTPLTNCYGYIDNVKVWIPVNDPTFGTHNTHDGNYIYPTPDEITDRRVYYDSLRTTTGTLQNSEYGSPYSSCIDEAYLIDAGEGNTVSYNVSDGSIAGHDYLFFYDGNTTDAKLIDMVAGYDPTITGTRLSSGRYMFVRLSTSRNDGGGNGFTGTISFQENENNPPSIEDQAFIINEQEYADNYIGRIIASDNDPGQLVTYSIVEGNESGLFSLDANSGDLITTQENVFGLPTQNYNLIIKVEDNGEDKKSRSANINIVFKKTLTIYIDPENQNDILEDGSPEHPYNSWQDIVWENGYSYLQKRGTISNESKISIYADNVTLGSYGDGEKPVIQSSAEESAIKAFEKSNITIKDVHIIAEKAISCIYISGTTSKNVIVENCALEAAENGVRVIDGMSITLRYNTISNCLYAVYSYAESNKIYYNVFKNNLNAINITSSLSSSEIYNNVFYENSTGVANSYSDLKLYNNIFYLVTAGDVAINQKMDSLLSDNNIFFPEQDGFIDIANNSFSTLADYQGKKGLDLNSFSIDPQFVDVYNNNFTLNNSSPAINTGIIVGLVKDFLGNLVPFGGAPDIGIIEKSASDISNQPSENAVKNKMSVFPNPSNGIFSISLKNVNKKAVNISVMDISGKTLIEKQYHSQDSNFVQTLDISAFPKGVYLILLKAANTIYSQCILKTY
jgi:hypothetical protein